LGGEAYRGRQGVRTVQGNGLRRVCVCMARNGRKTREKGGKGLEHFQSRPQRDLRRAE
jgi:hypothetical protein